MFLTCLNKVLCVYLFMHVYAKNLPSLWQCRIYPACFLWAPLCVSFQRCETVKHNVKICSAMSNVVRTRCTAPKKLMQLMLEAQVPSSSKIDSKSTPKIGSKKHMRNICCFYGNFNFGSNTGTQLNEIDWVEFNEFCAMRSFQWNNHSGTVKWHLTHFVFFVFHPPYSLQLSSALMIQMNQPLQSANFPSSTKDASLDTLLHSTCRPIRPTQPILPRTKRAGYAPLSIA